MLVRWLVYTGIAWLAYVVKESHLVQNLPFHLFPPDLPAQFAHLPHAASSGAPLEAFTARSDPSLAPAGRLAYCEDAGALWVVDALGNEGDNTHKVELEWAALERGEVEFHPLGLALVPPVDGDDDSGVRLFVVNHGAAQSTVEVFSLSSTTSSPPHRLAHRATHLLTVSHPSLSLAPNSIAPLSRTSFFVSHDHRHTSRSRSLVGRLANWLETVCALPYGRVDDVWFGELDGAGAGRAGAEVCTTTVVEGVSFANGLALSPEQDTLVVASTTRREVLFYNVRPSSSSSSSSHADASPTLTLRRTVSLPMLVDNLSLLPSSPNSTSLTLLAAGHPSYPALLSAAHGLNLRLRLPGPLREWASTLGAQDWVEWDVRLRADEQRGMSWVVAVQDPPVVDGGAKEHEWETVYQSSGRIDEGGFGGSTTAVAGGGSCAGGQERAWMAVVGLYEEGVRIVRQ
ncbi:hypothetical protein JCM8208_002408 [Rhodotorula glutinis]